MQIGDLTIEPIVDGVMKAKPSNFKGTTDELRSVIVDCVAGKRKGPALDKDEEAGFGPKYEAKSSKLVSSPWEALSFSPPWEGGAGGGGPTRTFAVCSDPPQPPLPKGGRIRAGLPKGRRFRDGFLKGGRIESSRY